MGNCFIVAHPIPAMLFRERNPLWSGGFSQQLKHVGVEALAGQVSRGHCPPHPNCLRL